VGLGVTSKEDIGVPNGFRVEPQAVRDFAQYIARCKDDTVDGIAYLERNGNLSWDEIGATNFIGGLKGAHERVMAELVERFTHLKDVFEKSANELESTATYYEETEIETAGQFDQELPDPGRVRLAEET
jgi:uncharacterized protein YukE